MRHSFIRETMYIFAFDMLVLIVLAYFIGEEAREISTMFRLGSEGLALETMVQYFLSAAVIAGWKNFFSSRRIFKKMMVLWRTVGRVFAVAGSMVCFVAVCGWFPIDSVEGWIGFVVSFIVCFVVSAGCMVYRTNRESRKYEVLLQRYQSSRSGESMERKESGRSEKNAEERQSGKNREDAETRQSAQSR